MKIFDITDSQFCQPYLTDIKIDGSDADWGADRGLIFHLLDTESHPLLPAADHWYVVAPLPRCHGRRNEEGF